MATINISLSEIVTAFHAQALGSKVKLEFQRAFVDELKEAILNHDLASDRQPGQHFIRLPSKVNTMVSAGVGPASNDPEHYVLRFHREKVSAYLKREFAAPVESVAVVVYTMDAYRKDPDCTSAEVARVEREGATHVLVAVLADAGPKGTPHSPFRLVHNLAGGNLEAEKWSADEIRAKCKDSIAYHNAWSTVAD